MASSRITELNANDVLLGRGSGPSSFIGNKRFREFVETRKEEYLATRLTSEKSRIAKEVVDHIHSLGGRFVRQERKGRKQGEILVGGLWREVANDIASEKCKQYLRENSEKKRLQRERAADDTTVESIPEILGQEASNQETRVSASNVLPTLNISSSLPVASQAVGLNTAYMMPTLFGNPQPPVSAAVDSRLLLFQNGALLAPASFPSHVISPSRVAGATTPTTSVLSNFSSFSSNDRDDEMQQDLELGSDRSSRKHRMEQEEHGDHGIDDKDDVPINLESDAAMPSEEAAAFVLSTLSVNPKERDVFSYEDFLRENASLSSEERADALADMFGKMNVAEGKPKRARMEQDSEAFLIEQMKKEIDKTPDSEKEALLIALSEARPEEFTNKRFGQFLRCESMDPKLAAKRFIGYWAKRRETFGDEDFTKRMALNELFGNDIVAMKTCRYFILPRKDLSGRTLMYENTSNHTREGYTSENMFRSIWYLFEVAANESTNGLVNILWMKDSSIFEYDPVFDRVSTHFQLYWPIRPLTIHLCCASSAVFRFIIPIIHAIVGKWLRIRMQMHNVSPDDITNVLKDYGILPEMLPSEMPGGQVEMNMAEWIAQRRAIEMEELP